MAKQQQKKSNVADDAYKKKVTVISACVVLVFAVAIVVGLFFAWKNGNHRYELFEEEKKAVAAVSKEEKQDTSSIEIDMNADNFKYWIDEIDNSYYVDKHTAGYHAYEGCTMRIQGELKIMEFSGKKYYFVCRQYVDDSIVSTSATEGASNAAETDATTMTATVEGGNSTTAMPYSHVEIQFSVEPKDEVTLKEGTWVEVVGTVGVDYTQSLGGLHDAVITEAEAPADKLIKY